MTAPQQHITVVVVDDQPATRRLTRLWLDDEPDLAVVGEAEDGITAIDAVEEHQPDVVLLDIGMPAMDGVRALPFLRRVSPSSLLVAYTNHVDLAERAIAGGADAVHLKSEPFPQVLDAVRRLVLSRRTPA